MAFKLGTSIKPHMESGQIKSTLTFKKDDPSIPGTPVIRIPLEEGVIAEANGPNHPQHPNSIYLNEKVEPGSDLEKQALAHEMVHLTAMRISPNKLAYTDNSITYEGAVYPRQTKNGRDMIQDVETGKWKEAGDGTWPWEKDANI